MVMTKNELVTFIAGEAQVTKKAAAAALGTLVKTIQEALAQRDGSIRIPDLGTFRVSHRKARSGVNPQTQKKIKIPAMNVPRFIPSKALRDVVKGAK
jgi:nucleoid DNA-binding protein